MPEPQSSDAARTAALLHIPREALPYFLKALEARTKLSTAPRSFIPDNSLCYTPTPNGFTLTQHSSQGSAVKGVAQFEEEGERLWIRWSLEFGLGLRLLVFYPLFPALGVILALVKKAPIQFVGMGVFVTLMFLFVASQIKGQVSRIANSRMLHCIVECILEAERSTAPAQSSVVPTEPTR